MQESTCVCFSCFLLLLQFLILISENYTKTIIRLKLSESLVRDLKVIVDV